MRITGVPTVNQTQYLLLYKLYRYTNLLSDPVVVIYIYIYIYI
jgi:hypothetical protein